MDHQDSNNENQELSTQTIEKLAAPNGDGVSCKDCKVGRGYRPFLDYVELCPLHRAAPALYEALERFAGLLNEIGVWTPIAGDGDGNAFLPCSMRISDLEQARAALAVVIRNQNDQDQG